MPEGALHHYEGQLNYSEPLDNAQINGDNLSQPQLVVLRWKGEGSLAKDFANEQVHEQILQGLT